LSQKKVEIANQIVVQAAAPLKKKRVGSVVVVKNFYAKNKAIIPLCLSH